MTVADDLRAAGWAVAVHNDYRLAGEPYTFWLFTHPNGRWIKGEGRTDDEALAICAQLALAASQQGPEIKGLDIASDCDGVEQEAFEVWAKTERFNMDQHPLHWLFLDPETSAARRGWRAGITHSRARIRTALAPSVGAEEPPMEQAAQRIRDGSHDAADVARVLGDPRVGVSVLAATPPPQAEPE